RFCSERYPLTSQLIQENKIPEFDNLYLDFNGIIHNCSHPDDEDAHFRMSEEQIFTSIFAYVDLLFGKMKPKKLFFIAVDGVAPRAKMNQQRSRRFRTAKEASKVREKTDAKGEPLPAGKAFDSNCITPGTIFMAKLSDQLRYFVNKKITEDANWRDIQVVLSGHDVPGEGEHKIMEYIRLSRAQPDYNPNVRHCLYGLDADLVMLGLLSHDPHFCLLREEVKSGPATKKMSGGSPESQTFYLLHLSLMREYLNLEFSEIEPVLPFDYSLERIIDDFVLLAVFVGNDFLPNLPDLHVNQNGLERLFDVYKKVLPSLGGYINESGTIDMKRLQVVLDEMKIWERAIFEKEYGDVNWFKGKRTKHHDMEVAPERTGLVLTRPQREILDKVTAFVLESRGKRPSPNTSLTMPNTFPARDRNFISTLSTDLHLCVTWDEYDEEDQNLVTLRLSGSMEDRVPPNGDDEESRLAVDRVLKEYEKVPTVDDDEGGGFDARHEKSINDKMDEWKRTYYKGKLNISYDNPEQMEALMFQYAEGLQWVMHYYYSGVASWSWFYNYHYAPRISDLQGVGDMEFSFELGKPFRPFEQLMGVLPSASKDLIPLAYQDLMNNLHSPIRDFYPVEFELDLNGKKHEWEAIVKIPFIDEARLLRAMSSRENRLTAEERRRNQYGTSTKFSFSTRERTVYPSSLPNLFPSIYRCACVMEPFELPTLDGLRLIPGLCDGVVLGAEALAGFPSLDTLPHTAQLGFHGVNVHGSESRNKSMVVHIQNPHENRKVEDIAKEMVGKHTFVGWPFLQEGRVVAVSDSLFKYQEMAVALEAPPKIVANPHAPQGLSHWKMKSERIEQMYSKKCGVITGGVEVLVHVQPLKAGMKLLESGASVKDYEGPDKEIEQAVQMVISQIASDDPRFLEKDPPPLSEEFPEGCNIFFLGEHAYGVAAQVARTKNDTLSVILAFFPSDEAENDMFKPIVQSRVSQQYYPAFKAANMLRISGRALSKITSSFMVLTTNPSKSNLGLSLKFEAKSLKVVDYSRKEGRFWEFSEKTIDLVREYKTKFPEVFQVLNYNGDEMARASDIFGENADARVKEVKSWLKSKGVCDFEPVSLFSDQLSKETVREIEEYADSIKKGKSPITIKRTMVKNIPRHAVLKPGHSIYRLQNQRFALGDRVTMVQDSGGVPLSIKGVVIGINTKTIDVIWDIPLVSGVTLGDRCSQHRGFSVQFNSCLNLSNPQFIASTHPKSAPPPLPNVPRAGPCPAIRPPSSQPATAGFRPAPAPHSYALFTHKIRQHLAAIMANPQRGHGGFTIGNGWGGSYIAATSAPAPAAPGQPSNDNTSRGGFTSRGPPNSHQAPAPTPATISQPASNNNVAASSRNMNKDQETVESVPHAPSGGGGPHVRGGFSPKAGFNGIRGRGFA
ncbi:hypothetical protein PAXINDRAFT_48683, partial [Paxillus involutus ATCC 200175]